VDGTGSDWRGKEWIGRERKGSSFRRRRNVTAELPKEGNGGDGIGWERTGVDWRGFNQSPVRKLIGLFS
jgi:hypothetical protein